MVPFGWYNPPRKLTCSRKGANGSVDLPKTKSRPICLGNQLHSSIPLAGSGRHIPLAVYMAQNRRGFVAESLADASANSSSLGRITATPATPRRNWRRSIVVIGSTMWLLVLVMAMNYFFKNKSLVTTNLIISCIRYPSAFNCFPASFSHSSSL